MGAPVARTDRKRDNKRVIFVKKVVVNLGAKRRDDFLDFGSA